MRSIAVWCGANESSPPQAVDTGLAQAVHDLDPAILYTSNSAAGISTSGGPYRWVPPTHYFSGNSGNDDFGFHTEIGLPTVPVAETMQHLAGDEPAWPIGDPWYLHDWCTHGNQSVDSATDWQVQVANHTTRPLSATVTAELFGFDGTALATPQRLN